MLTLKALSRIDAADECCDILRRSLSTYVHTCNESARNACARYAVSWIGSPEYQSDLERLGKPRHNPRIKVGQDGIGVPFSRFPRDMGKKWNSELELSVHVYIYNVAVAYYTCLKEREREKQKLLCRGIDWTCANWRSLVNARRSSVHGKHGYTLHRLSRTEKRLFLNNKMSRRE